MSKPKNLKQRTSDDTMKPLNKVKLTPFAEVEQRGWGSVRNLSHKGPNELILDWRIQWGESGHNQEAHQRQLVEITLGNKSVLVSRQELERYLRHV